MNEYIAYEIKVEDAERWMDRPIKVSFITPTSAGSTSTTVYLDEAERDELIRLLTAHADGSS